MLGITRQVRPEDDKPAAIVLDTLNRSLKGSESSDEDMGDYVKAADALREAFECAVIVVHHCGIDGTRPRGHTSLTGAVDAQLSVKREVGDVIVVTVDMMKDGAQGDTIASTLEVVDVGIDEDGEPITSCIIRSAETPDAKTRRKVTGQNKIALDQLTKALIDGGEPAPASNHMPPGIRVVRESLWRRYCYDGQITETDTAEAKQKAFVRAAKRLQVDGLIGKWGEWVWIA